MCLGVLLKMSLLKNFLVCLMLFSIQTAYAATLKVTSIADSGPGSLRQTISDAVSDDVIYFDASLNGLTITLASTIKTEIDNKNLTIDAMSLPGGLLIDGSAMPNTLAFRFGIQFDSAGYTLIIRGITFNDVAAVPLYGGPKTSLFVDYCTFQNNDEGISWDFGGGDSVIW